MQTLNGNHICQTDSRHKFDSALTEYVHDEMMDTWGADSSGDAESTTGWFAQIGKRILRGDSRGFVWIEKFDDVHAADQIVAALNLADAAWICDDDGDDEFDEDTYANVLAYLAYCYVTIGESCDCHTFDAWTIHGSPTGPL